MKNAIVMTICIICCFLSCVSKKITGETTSNSPKPQGIIEVTTKGYGTLKSASVMNAIENAFTNILINGIPDSNQKRPLLGNNAQHIFEKNKKYFENLFKTEIASFILSQKILAFNPGITSQASSEVWLQINLDAFRRKLEADKIITTFGL